VKRVLFLLCVLIAANLLGSCSSTSSTLTTSARATMAASLPRAPVTPLVGVYATTITKDDVASSHGLNNEVGTWLITFQVGGTYVGLLGYDAPIMGQYTMTQDRVILKNLTCLQSAGPGAETGIYAWTLKGNMLTLKVVSDLCPYRKLVATAHPLLKRS
jgi:hypothetical protein